MGSCIIKLNGKYMEWTSISDSPRTPLMTEEQLRQYWRREYGRCRWPELAEILNKLKTSDVANSTRTINEIIKDNRAGKNESTLTKSQIIAEYSVDYDEFISWHLNQDRAAERWYEKYNEHTK